MEWKKGVISGIIAGIVMIVIGSAFMMIPGVTQWYSVTFPEMSSPMAMSTMMAGIILIHACSVKQPIAPSTSPA